MLLKALGSPRFRGFLFLRVKFPPPVSESQKYLHKSLTFVNNYRIILSIMTSNIDINASRSNFCDILKKVASSGNAVVSGLNSRLFSIDRVSYPGLSDIAGSQAIKSPIEAVKKP